MRGRTCPSRKARSRSAACSAVIVTGVGAGGPELRYSAKAAAEALHSAALDGKKPSAAALRDAWLYIEGRRTLDEIIDDVVRRHTRRPEQES